MAEERNELYDVTTEALIDELMRRHKALLVVREKDSPTDSTRTQTLFDYSGGLNAALGMAVRAQADIEAAAMDGDDDDDED